MNRSIVPEQPDASRGRAPSFGTRWARRKVLSRLAGLGWGALTVRSTHQSADPEAVFGDSCEGACRAAITVHDPRFFSALVWGGSLGAAESFMAGHWSCDDLTALIRILIRNLSVLDDVDGGWAIVSVPLRRLVHWLRRNTRTGSRDNIAAHYDLGNEFYALFLDRTMTYSCGIFENEDASSLEEASIAKYDRLCRKLALSSEDHVLEIGTGWGGFALHAAGRYGCRVTTTTISQSQHEFARARVAESGLDDRIELLTDDYRDLTGTFDKLVSIEMIEAVGHDHLREFFRVCGARLKPDGLMALQAITILDQQYADHVRTVDFIKRYVFPGCCLTSITSMCGAATRMTDLKLVHLEDITPHYAETLRRWRAGFGHNVDRVREMGFPESFVRLWEYYLCYCEAGFTERYIGDVQMILAKPLNRSDPILPSLDGV